jgi:hypothetical protein
MDVYAQAQTPDKRAAQSLVIAQISHLDPDGPTRESGTLASVSNERVGT